MGKLDGKVAIVTGAALGIGAYYARGLAAEGFMRSDDHQFFQPIYISSFGSLTDKTKDPFDEENTGWGWHLVSKVDTAQTILPTTCKMKRPD